MHFLSLSHTHRSGFALPAWPGAAARALAGVFEPQGEALAPWLAVALGAGVLLYFAGTTEPDPTWRWLAPPLILAALLAARRHALAAWAIGLAAAAALGFATASWHAGRAPPALEPPRAASMVSGVVQAVELLPEGRRVTLGAARAGEEGPYPRLVRVRLRADDPARPQPGDRLTVRALLRAPSAPTHPGAWDFQRAAWFSGLGASGFALAPASIAPGDAPAPAFAATRAAIEARVTAVIAGPAGAIAAALLTGGQGAIPPRDLAAMRDSGLAHLLSVSGLHIAIVMGVSFGLLRFAIACVPALALRSDGRLWPSLGGLLAGGAYMLLTGLQVPMLRSFAMAALVTLGLMLGRRALSPRVLAFAAAVVLLAQPDAVLGPSFQMSFAAVLALIAGYEALRPLLPAPRGGQGALAGLGRRAALVLLGLVLTSLLAGAATMPFGLHHFGRAQLYGMAANAVAVPLTSLLVMPAGMLALVLMPLGLDAWPLAVMGWGCQAVLAVARLVAAWPGAALPMRPIPAAGLLAASFGFLLLCLWRGRWRLLGVPVIAAGLAAGAVIRPPDILVSADARVIMLRAGEEVFVLRGPGGSAFVRDAFLRAFGLPGAIPLPTTGEVPPLTCSAEACRLAPAPGVAALLIRNGATAGRCGQAAVLVSPEPLRPRCHDAISVDRFSVWREGPQAVWLRPEGAVVLSDRTHRGDRPWVPGPPVPRQRGDALPPAPVE